MNPEIHDLSLHNHKPYSHKSTQTRRRDMKITWIGHSCFKIEEGGYSIVIDPYDDNYVPGLKPVRESAQVVLASHEHGDHNARNRVTLVPGGEGPFTITKIETYHDPEKGALRGRNTIHVFRAGGKKIAHFGGEFIHALPCAFGGEIEADVRQMDAFGHFARYGVDIADGGADGCDFRPCLQFVDDFQRAVAGCFKGCVGGIFQRDAQFAFIEGREERHADMRQRQA